MFRSIFIFILVRWLYKLSVTNRFWQMHFSWIWFRWKTVRNFTNWSKQRTIFVLCDEKGCDAIIVLEYVDQVRWSRIHYFLTISLFIFISEEHGMVQLLSEKCFVLACRIKLKYCLSSILISTNKSNNRVYSSDLHSISRFYFVETKHEKKLFSVHKKRMMRVEKHLSFAWRRERERKKIFKKMLWQKNETPMNHSITRNLVA